MTEVSADHDHVHPVRTGLAVIVWTVASAHLAILGYVLYTGVIHPLKYDLLRWPTDVSLIFPAVVGAVMGGVVLAVSTLRTAAGARAARCGALGHAMWPAVLCVSWAGVAWMHAAAQPSVLCGLIILASIVPAGWAIGRVAALRVPADADDASRPVRWWREPAWWIVVGVVLAASLFHVVIQAALFRMWIYGSPDIGYYAEMLLNVLRGRGLYCEAFGHHFFGEHFSPGLYLLVPVYACYPHVHTLMVVGAVAVSSGALAIYALCRVREIGPWSALMLSVAYLLFPASSRVIYGGSYGFHEILLAIPLMLWSFYHLARRQWIAGALFVVLALSMKENVAIVYAAYGMCVVLGDRRQWWGAALAVMCVAYFCVVMCAIVPAWNTAGAYSKLYLFESLGQEPAAILKTLITQPHIVFGRLLRWRVLGFALTLLAPVACIATRRTVLLAAVPTFVFICLMNTLDFASVRFWHQSSILAVVWFATLEGCTRCSPRQRRARVVAVVVCCALAHYALGLSPGSRLWRDLPLDPGARPVATADLQALIPRGDTVQATPRLAAHFVDYERVYPLHLQPDPPPEWIVVDGNDNFAGESAMRDMHAHLGRLINARRYTIVWQRDAVTVLRRVSPNPAHP